MWLLSNWKLILGAAFILAFVGIVEVQGARLRDAQVDRDVAKTSAALLLHDLNTVDAQAKLNKQAADRERAAGNSARKLLEQARQQRATSLLNILTAESHADEPLRACLSMPLTPDLLRAYEPRYVGSAGPG